MEQLKSQSTLISQKLNRLMEQGILTKNGNYYYFQDKLFRFWVKYVYQARLKSIDEDFLRQKERFREEIHQSVYNFQTMSQKDLSARIVDLLCSFDSEAFELNGRRYKLPTFADITPWQLEKTEDHRFNVIRATSREGVWLVILKEDTLQESEVAAFLSETKKLEEKTERRVIISLSELDANARLKALQEKMWIWSENELNTLLNLFDKPYIVK